jgi:serine/threonine protein kinase
MSAHDSDKDSVTEVAEESFVRERPLEIQRGAVLAGRYQVEEMIGKGGSGVVLRVFDRTVQSVVALKVLKSELARDAKWDKRFSRELRLGRPIQHPNVCRIFDIGEADGHRFLTMELATGGSLRDELKRRPAVDRPIEDRLADARAAIDGLAAIHATGVVHRDFKPDNLLRMEDGRLVISDFGLATDTATAPGVTVMIGTPHYMAPEVLAGEPATARSDVWALGVVLHEIFFGRRPERKQVSFDGSGKGPVRTTSNIEKAMLELCEACLDESPLVRPADAREVADRFERSRQEKPDRSRVKLGVLAASIIVAATIIGGAAFRARSRTPQVQTAAQTDAGRFAINGVPADWTKSVHLLADVPGHMHCLLAVSQRVLRIVWGAPQRIEDVDLITGETTVLSSVPGPFSVSCPDWSTGGHGLLFVARNSAGVNEIRLSATLDGSQSTVVTLGSDPVWLGGDASFLYTIDGAHAAVFSMATKQFTLLPELGQRTNILVGDKVVDRTGKLAALLVYDDRAEAEVDLVDLGSFRQGAHWGLPRASHLAFDPGGALVVAGTLAGGRSSLARCDVARRTCDQLGWIPGWDISGIAWAGHRMIVVGDRVTSDAWIYDHGTAHRLTTDGHVYSAAQSITGEFLFSKREDGDRMSIWVREGNGTDRRLTDGTMDLCPSFSPSGREWTYVDYSKKGVMACAGAGASCRILKTDDSLPLFPVFAPNGSSIAYLTQLGRTQVRIIDAHTGSDQRAWDAVPVCPPVWSETGTLWTVESNSGRHYWAEHDASTGQRIGGPLPFASEEQEDFERTNCQPAGADESSPLFQRISIRREHEARVFVAPMDASGSARGADFRRP